MRDKVCLITGGSRGGMLKQIAIEFHNHGAKAVILMSRNKEKNEEVARSVGPNCHSFPGDVAKIESCQQVCKAVVEQFGRIDVLVNGAAGNFLATAEKISSNGVKKVLEIDTIGTFNMSQSVFRASMKDNRSGVILNISATLHWNGSWAQVHSSAAKAGVDAITKVLAVEWGPYGVRVCGIVPGPIEGTEGFSRLGDINNLNNKDKANAAHGQKGEESAMDQLRKTLPV
jgi:peroxisomal 2,4-dienoyl-CoA reductase